MPIAVSMPGKIGDAIYALPVARELCRKHKTTCDFYTSDYCTPLKRLFEYQWYVDNFIVPEEYHIERMDMGVQPWRMPVKPGYDAVYHLGYRYVPNISLPDFMAKTAGIEFSPKIEYQYPEIETLDEPYMVMAARGESSYKDLFLEVIEKSPIRVVQIGGKGEYIGDDPGATGMDMLETVSWISKAEAFVGLMSSQLALANGFNIPKVAPHDGVSWDMRHVVYSPRNFYPINPSADDILYLALETPEELLYCKSLNPVDYGFFTEDQHVKNVSMLLNMVGAPYRFEHEHRLWEYGIVLNALRKFNIMTVLDVGGGGSLFAPAAAFLHMNVTQVDPGDVGGWISTQAHSLDLVDRMHHEQVWFTEYQGTTFDAVTCISTLEHVQDDVAFFDKLLDHAEMLVAITVDFSPDGEKKLDGHLRTYNERTMLDMIDRAAKRGFYPPNGHNYRHFGEYVHNYSFASLILVKEN